MRDAEKETSVCVRFNVAIVVDTRSPSIIPYLYQGNLRGGIASATAKDQCGHDDVDDNDERVLLESRFATQSRKRSKPKTT